MKNRAEALSQNCQIIEYLNLKPFLSILFSTVFGKMHKPIIAHFFLFLNGMILVLTLFYIIFYWNLHIKPHPPFFFLDPSLIYTFSISGESGSN